ncbi:MAG: hypothetical protein O9292_08665 [Rhodobacteraceae bacterium]|nr:hypothetical protein [Paracoccaceae bacterium]
MTDTIIGAVVRLASPLGQWGARLRAGLARRPWLRLVMGPLILLVAAGCAVMALLAGRHGLALLTLFIALPLATLCLILCRDKDGEQ